MSRDAVRAAMPPGLQESGDEALTMLGFYGLVHDDDDEAIQVGADIFRRWFPENVSHSETKQGTATAAQGKPRSADDRSVFVVHGRNLKAKKAMFSLLEAAGLRPLEWEIVASQHAPQPPTIPGVLEMGFKMAQAAVVLLTGDDEARVREEYKLPGDQQYETDLTPQPRPNVLCEAGMAMGLFPEKTVLVEIGMTRPFTDIDGLLRVRLDGSAEALKRRRSLLRRLKMAGCAVNWESDRWLDAGEF